MYLYLLNKREENELTKAIADNNARIIDPAYGSSTPVAPRSVIILFIALLFGLATPFGIIYLMEILDTTIRGRKDIEDKLSIPFLGDIPEYHGSTRQGSVVVRDNGRDSVSEAFRLIRSNLGFMSVKSGKLQIIMVTSSNPHAGKTFVTTNLAMTLALADKKVVIVDLDLRRRTLSKQMGQRDNRNGVWATSPERSPTSTTSSSRAACTRISTSSSPVCNRPTRPKCSCRRSSTNSWPTCANATTTSSSTACPPWPWPTR